MIFDWAKGVIVDFDEGTAYKRKMVTRTFPRYELVRCDGGELPLNVRRYDTETHEIVALITDANGLAKLNARGDAPCERLWFCACRFVERATGKPVSFEEVRRYALTTDR